VRFLPLGILIILFSACLNEPDCIVTSSTDVKMSLHKITSDSARAVEFAYILVSGTDTVFYENDSVTSVVVPVNPNATQTMFRFFYESKIDTLVLSYTRQTKVISPPCGAFNYFQNLKVVSSTFPEALVINPQLSTSAAPNVTIKL
jgi:Family of unknown function (DUF6452)